jgi:hypothetical protein
LILSFSKDYLSCYSADATINNNTKDLNPVKFRIDALVPCYKTTVSAVNDNTGNSEYSTGFEVEMLK